jgi:hypothetical protein
MTRDVDEPPLPTLVLRRETDELGTILRDLALLVRRHPVAMQAACRALVAEGRRFVETPEGRAWHARLAGSELVRRGRILWEASALDLLDDRGDARLPTAFVDALVGVLTSEEFLGRVMRAPSRRISNGGSAPTE